MVLTPLRSVAAAIFVLAIGPLAFCSGNGCEPPAWELQILHWLAEQRNPALDVLFVTVTWVGSLWLLLPLAIALVAAQVAGGHNGRALFFAAAFGGAVALAYFAKIMVARARPSALEPLVTMPGDLSFPSGHAMQITAFALAAVMALVPPKQRGRWFALAWIAIVLVGTSRLYLQVHFPSDVLAGTAAAALWVFGFVAVNKERHA